MATTAMSRQSLGPGDRLLKRKKEQRTDIWSGLLRQTREAQARSRTQAVQHRELVVCGGSSDDQQAFVQSLARPPPSQPPTARNQERRDKKGKGELRLSNRYAYGYGHVKLFSSPQQGVAGVQALGSEAEEVAQTEIHTLPEPTEEYVGTLRRLLSKKQAADLNNADGELLDDVEGEVRRPGICVLLSWKKPWKFLDQLRRWLQILAKALLQPGVTATDPLDIIKDAQLRITVVVQNVEAQEDLFKEGFKEDDFDYISQCLRTSLLPLHPLSSLVYTSSSAPPQQPGSALTEVQKVVFSSIDLDLGALSPKPQRSGEVVKKEDLGPKHEFMDRMAIVIPAGWDSVAFIRTLSETFAPEDMLSAWLADLQPSPESEVKSGETTDESKLEAQANGGAEVYESSPVEDDSSEEPVSPSKLSPSAVRSYEQRVEDPQAHKASKTPEIEVTTKPDQKFLAEMREHIQQLEAVDREREASGRSTGVSNTSISSAGRSVGMPTGEDTGALHGLGDVSFNVGGVSYDTISAEAAIERLKRPPTASSLQSPMSPPGARTSTPKPPRANRDLSDDSRPSADRGTPKEPSSVSTRASSSETKELPIDKLEEYFQSLMRKGGSASRDATPTKSKE